MVLSKSKLIAYRQCPKRFWLEVHQRDLIEVSKTTQASLNVGYQVGEIARQIYDPGQQGVFIDIQKEGFAQALASSQALINVDVPIFEAGFSGDGLLAFADVMLPMEVGGARGWKMVEVKSSTSAKDYHLDDIAVQSYVAEVSGFKLHSVALAHIDSRWVYPGNGDYAGLLVEKDLTAQSLARNAEVQAWAEDARQILAGSEPEVAVGAQCFSPYACGFYTYCTRNITVAEFPIEWLPRLGKKAQKLAEQGVMDMREVPDHLLNAMQRRVKNHTLQNTSYFDIASTRAVLSQKTFPAYFLDFETINFAVPIWAGTRPYQQVPFQYSLHVMQANGDMQHFAFLDISGNDPSRRFAEQLITQCGHAGPVYVYNAGFEGARLTELAKRFAEFSEGLMAIKSRLFDLLPLAREHYYHPSQQGSWSIKKVLPALVPELSYSQLEGVQDGGMAMGAFVEALQPTTSPERKSQIESQLLAYCQQDTWAMVKIFEAFVCQ